MFLNNIFPKFLKCGRTIYYQFTNKSSRNPKPGLKIKEKIPGGKIDHSKNLAFTRLEAESFNDQHTWLALRNKPFSTILRESKLMQCADFNGRLVVGEIFHRHGDILYIDIGMKLPIICEAPEHKEKYVIGATVLVKLFNPELSEPFLGAKKEITILEADGQLLGLYDREVVEGIKDAKKELRTATDPTTKERSKKKLEELASQPGTIREYIK